MPAANYSVSAWTPVGHKSERPYTTSSGAECLIRDLEIEDMIDLDLMDQMDSLSAIVQTDHIERVQTGKKPQDKKPKKLTKAQEAQAEQDQFKAMMKDKKAFESIKITLDKVVATCVLQPKLLDPWIFDPNAVTPSNPRGRRKMDANERDPEAAYLDYVNLMDKIGIFNEVFGGMEQLQQFREASNKGVGDLADESESANRTS